jgi:predicted nucleic acid-binding protein
LTGAAFSDTGAGSSLSPEHLGSNTDFLICAVAVRHGLPIFTKDNDFKLYQKHIKLEIHQTIR